MKKMLSVCCMMTFSLTWFANLQGETTEVLLSNSMKCSKEELMRFFPEQVVQSILIKAGVPQDKAKAVADELSKKDLELARIVEEKSEKVDPHPFKDLTQREAASRIYRETLHEVFAKVLKENGVTNEEQIQVMLDELQEARSKLFIECIRKQPH